MKKLLDAALALADEVADFPEFQKAVDAVHEAAEEAQGTTFSSPSDRAFRFASTLWAYKPPRMNYYDGDLEGVDVACLAWREGAYGLLIAVSAHGDATYTIRTDEDVLIPMKEFRIEEPIPVELENFLKLHFTLNPTIQ